MAGATIEITTASADAAQEAVAAMLRELLDAHDLSRWAFTDRVRIASMVVPHSHPVLVLNTRRPEPDVLLATYLHEQLHWWLDERDDACQAAMSEIRERWPDPPGQHAGGARDPHSTWLHLVLCPLEIAALETVLPADRAAKTVASLDVYRWVYDTIVADRPWFDALVARHGLIPPMTPPEARHMIPQATIPSAGVDIFTFDVHPEREAVAVAAVVAVHERFPGLDRLAGERDVLVDVDQRTGFGVTITVGEDFLDDPAALALVYGYAQAVTFSLAAPDLRPALEAVPPDLAQALGGGIIGISTAIGGALLLRTLDTEATAALERLPFMAQQLGPLLARLDEIEALLPR